VAYDPLIIVPGDVRDGYAFAREHRLGPDKFRVIMDPISVPGLRGGRYIVLERARKLDPEGTAAIVALLRYGDYREIPESELEQDSGSCPT
jgi:hypothetical protein